MRIDQVLHWLCLQKSRSQTAKNCREGRILLDGKTIRPAAPVTAGSEITILNPLGERLKKMRLLSIPQRQISRKEAGGYYQELGPDDENGLALNHE